MERARLWSERFKLFFLNNRFVIFLLVLFLISINIFMLSKIPYVFTPLIVLVKTVILPIILSGILFYLFNPLVDFLERHKVKRIYSIILLYILIIGVLVLIISLVIPVIKSQILELIGNIPTLYDQATVQIQKWLGSDVFLQIQQSLNVNPQELLKTLSARGEALFSSGFSGFASTFSGIGGFLGTLTEVILSIVTVPFILFYLLKDGKKLPSYILQFIPVNLRGQTSEVMSEMNNKISSYIRGQIIVSFCIGILLYIGYNIIGLDYALVLAIIASFTSIVPYLGPAIAITPALVVALVTSPVMLLKMIVVWTVVQLIEGKLISPQIMGKSLKVHPITIIFVILTAGNLFGVVGILLAVPGYAVLKVVITHLFEWLKKSSDLYETKKVTEKPIEVEPKKV
ncbi:AI-2E family transporter [Paenibacillus hunanensis]|uniref:AI-2E family transporter n=1 Tax=Paenibacillus hunanensis TaxID=539262 RepID=UPI0020269E9D|nr:AI-2E family transporter [Paenibacillus hunanensis]MCL9660106.1 AI-2E family transporter [Paenibacillus hunanensis]WPP39756.1 AI-2E family transporter [Paenibacillus hunanensis]